MRLSIRLSRCATARGAQRGVGLIELLIAVLVAAIGFLATAQMQVQGMRFSQGAYHRSQATLAVSDIIARMRANPVGVKAGHYDGMSMAAGLTEPDCSGAYCDSATIALRDRAQWSAYLHPAADGGAVPLLPGTTELPASGEVVRLAEGRYAANLSWTERIGGQDVAVPMRIDFVVEVRP